MNSTVQFPQIALRIISEQGLILGPIAWKEASKVNGLKIDESHTSVSLNGDAKDIINHLVSQYANAFGKVSNEVCKEAVRDLIAELPDEDVPSSLR